MVDRILDRANRSLRLVAAVQIVTGSNLEE